MKRIKFCGGSRHRADAMLIGFESPTPHIYFGDCPKDVEEQPYLYGPQPLDIFYYFHLTSKKIKIILPRICEILSENLSIRNY